MSDLLADPQLLLVAAIAGGGLLALLFAFDKGGGKQAQRVERVRTRRQGPSRATDGLQLRRENGDRRPFEMMMRRFVPQPELLRQRLRRTGRPIGIGGYVVTCLVLALVTIGGMLVFRLSPALAVPGGFLVGLWLPHMVIGWLGGRRAMRFTMLFPEAIGLMVRGVKSGLPITESFQIVGHEVPDPVGLEFRRISDLIRVGQPVDQVLWDAARRVATPELKFLVVTLSVQRETGGNLAETLENLDNILRRRRQMRLKIKAMSSEARASAMIIGALPFLMMTLLSVVNNEYVSLLFTTHRGHIMLGVGASSMTLGIGIMSKMVRFEI
jgi:tight adherence protein B